MAKTLSNVAKNTHIRRLSVYMVHFLELIDRGTDSRGETQIYDTISFSRQSSAALSRARLCAVATSASSPKAASNVVMSKGDDDIFARGSDAQRKYFHCQASRYFTLNTQLCKSQSSLRIKKSETSDASSHSTVY